MPTAPRRMATKVINHARACSKPYIPLRVSRYSVWLIISPHVCDQKWSTTWSNGARIEAVEGVEWQSQRRDIRATKAEISPRLGFWRARTLYWRRGWRVTGWEGLAALLIHELILGQV